MSEVHVTKNPSRPKIVSPYDLPAAVSLKADASAALADIAEASALLKKIPQIPTEVVQVFLALGDNFLEIGRPEELPTAGAVEIRVSLQITQRFREFLCALRALDGDLSVI